MKNKILSAILGTVMAYMPMTADSAEIKHIPYRHFQKVRTVSKPQSSALMDIIAKEDIKLDGVVPVQDEDKFYNKIMKASDKIGYKNIKDYDTKGFISYNSAITKYLIQNYPATKAQDKIPLEDRIKDDRWAGKQSVTGTCRHYAQFVKDVFYATRHLNPNAENMECIVVGNRSKRHAWNMYLFEGDSGIESTETDVGTEDYIEEHTSPSPMWGLTSHGAFQPFNTKYAPQRGMKADFWNRNDKKKD